MPNYAMIDSDDKIPFWRAVGEAAHRHDCKYIAKLSHSGSQRDNPGIENFRQKCLSSTNRMDTFHGLLCDAMTLQQIKDTIQHFAQGARRAREAGLDGVELHASHGYLILDSWVPRSMTDQTSTAGTCETGPHFCSKLVR